MNWGEIQIESLRKMFLGNTVLILEKLNSAEPDGYYINKKYKLYLDKMPQVCNEAISKITELKRPIIKKYTLIPIEGTLSYDLKELITDYKRTEKIVGNYKSKINNEITLLNDNDRLDIYYQAYPEKITNTTENNFVIPIDQDISYLIPFYIAGELYKDDDLSLATIYMNEFISGLNEINQKEKSRIEPIIDLYGLF